MKNPLKGTSFASNQGTGFYVEDVYLKMKRYFEGDLVLKGCPAPVAAVRTGLARSERHTPIRDLPYCFYPNPKQAYTPIRDLSYCLYPNSNPPLDGNRLGYRMERMDGGYTYVPRG